MKSMLLLAGCLVLFSCQNKAKTEDADETGHEVHMDDANEQVSTVFLNNGEKWPANPETTQGIRNMEAHINTFMEQSKVEDCLPLRAKMEEEFNMIIQKCTMEGEAHNQLHNYLIPIAEMINKWDTRDIQLCIDTVNELKKHLNEYNKYFA